MIITIDGPTASGKSTVGRTLAQKKGYYYLYSGLLYRALSYLLIKNYDHTLDTIAHPQKDEVTTLLDTKRFIYRYDNEEQILFDKEDITPFLKEQTIDQGASIVSTNLFVRERIDALQHAIAGEHNVVVDGRDAGSVVFPHAEHKFFITASSKERAARWRAQQIQKGAQVSFDDAYWFVVKRDQRDTKRANAPLCIPDNARVIDTTSLSINQTLETITMLIE